MKRFLLNTKLLVIAFSVVLASCGGGGSDTAVVDAAASTALKGTAAAGAAIIGTVTVKGSLGLTRSELIEADGTYNVDVSGLTAPYRLRAQGTVGGRTYKLHSYAEAADVGGNVNITPFTDLIVANAAGQVAAAYFESNSPADLDPADVEAQEAALQAKLETVLTALGVDSAINLLNSTFSADHSGLDAALDVVRIEVDAGLQVATITNLLENTTVSDSVTDTEDNTEVLAADPTTINAGVSDIQQIAGRFDALTAAFANGLPTQASIEDIFSADFSDEDQPRGPWLTDITTNPILVGLAFSSVVVSNLDSTAGTATVTVNVNLNGFVDPEPIIWLMGKDVTLGWQIRGDQRIVDTEFSFHCNDNDGNGGFAGACGVNTQFWDEDFSNNSTGNVAIASGTVSIINGSDGTTVKDVIYLGTPNNTAPGDVQVYNEGTGQYQGDYRGFGTGAGEIDSAIFNAGDIIQYELFTDNLNVTTPSSPQVTGTVVATYTDTLVFAPSTDALYPAATAATLIAISNFAIGNDLTIAWTLAAGTRNSEVLVLISDSVGNRLEIWDDTFGTTATNTTIDSAGLDATAASDAGLNGDAANYSLLVRIYAQDEISGQFHSRDYTATDLATPPPPAGLACNYQSGWDDLADGGLGAPIVPKSFADFEESLATCATDGTPAQLITVADVAGTIFVDTDETTTFDALGGAAGTQADPGTGTYQEPGETILFEWYVENATCSGCTHSYLVQYSDQTIDSNLVGLSFRETTAVTNVVGANFTFHHYSEQSNFSTDGLVRETGADGEIWNSISTLQ